jgi:hypothetical protein
MLWLFCVPTGGAKKYKARVSKLGKIVGEISRPTEDAESCGLSLKIGDIKVCCFRTDYFALVK